MQITTWANQKQLHAAKAKRKKMRVSKTGLGLIFLLIGYRSGASFANKLTSKPDKAKPKQMRIKAFDTQLKITLWRWMNPSILDYVATE